MRSFKEYYDLAMREHIVWLSNQKEEWWKKDKDDKLNPLGDFIETVSFLSIDEKNDSSLFYNHTNVKNSEIGILFAMLGQALVDWCCENVEWKNLWYFGISINRSIDGCSNVYDCSFSVNKYDFVNRERIDVVDEDELKKFDGCDDFLCDLVDTFMSIHGKDIPNDWNYFSFGLDSLMDSCKCGGWIFASDGYMNIGNLDENTDEYDEYVECM